MSNKSVCFLLLALCIAVSVNAQDPGMPGIDMGKCLSTIQDVPGCLFEIRQSVLSGQFSIVGPACCKACQDAEANCVPELIATLFPPLLTKQCSPQPGSPATPGPPAATSPPAASGPPATPSTGGCPYWFC